MNLKEIWKEALMAYSRYYSITSLEGLRKTTKKTVISGILAKIFSL
jgi:hypothetical protein